MTYGPHSSGLSVRPFFATVVPLPLSLAVFILVLEWRDKATKWEVAQIHQRSPPPQRDRGRDRQRLRGSADSGEKEAVKKRNKGASIYDVYTEGGGHKMHQICGQIEYIFCGQRGGEGVNKSPSPVDVINGSP